MTKLKKKRIVDSFVCLFLWLDMHIECHSNLPQGGLLNSYAIFYITVDTLLIDRYSREREREKKRKKFLKFMTRLLKITTKHSNDEADWKKRWRFLMLFLLFHYSNGEDGCYTEKKKITKRLGYTFFFFVPLSFLFCSVTSNYPKEKKRIFICFFPHDLSCSFRPPSCYTTNVLSPPPFFCTIYHSARRSTRHIL